MNRHWAAANQLVHLIGRHRSVFGGRWVVEAVCGEHLITTHLEGLLPGNTNKAPSCLQCIARLFEPEPETLTWTTYEESGIAVINTAASKKIEF